MDAGGGLMVLKGRLIKVKIGGFFEEGDYLCN